MLRRALKIAATMLVFMLAAGVGTYMTVHLLIRGENKVVVPMLVGKQVVYALETRVRHKEHSELVGTIIRHERHESGCISPVPFYVLWDDGKLARELLGMLHWYQDAGRVEPIEEEVDDSSTE